MKERKSKAYLVIGTMHLGYSQQILDLFATVAKYYKASVVHIGPVLTDAEIKKYHRLQKEIDYYENLDDLTEQQVKSQTKKAKERQYIGNMQRKRLQDFIDTFGKISIVTNDSYFLEDKEFCPVEDVTLGYGELSAHLKLSSVMPTGERTTGSPITQRSLLNFRQHGKSWIVPHPTPAVESFPREGLNQAYNYFTTGSLLIQKDPSGPRFFSKCANDPSAVLVLIDEQNGEFHPKQIHIDFFRGETSHRLEPMILDDGLLFSAEGVKEVGSEDKAVASSDDHAPHQHMGVLATTRALNKLHKPALFVNNGDASDFESVNRHAADRPGEREGLRIREDLESLRKLLDAQASEPCIKRKVLVDSNHHEWLSIFVMENPGLIGELDWQTVAKERFPDWDVMLRTAGGDKTLKFGDYSIRHGDKESGARQGSHLFIKYFGGHFHRYHAYRRAISVGPGCRLGPKYLSNRITAWQNQVSTFTKYKEVAAVNPKTVMHSEGAKVSRFAYRNKILEVPFHKYEDDKKK